MIKDDGNAKLGVGKINLIFKFVVVVAIVIDLQCQEQIDTPSSVSMHAHSPQMITIYE